LVKITTENGPDSVDLSESVGPSAAVGHSEDLNDLQAVRTTPPNLRLLDEAQPVMIGNEVAFEISRDTVQALSSGIRAEARLDVPGLGERPVVLIEEGLLGDERLTRNLEALLPDITARLAEGKVRETTVVK
jgi:hypothetical protein